MVLRHATTNRRVSAVAVSIIAVPMLTAMGVAATAQGPPFRGDTLSGIEASFEPGPASARPKTTAVATAEVGFDAPRPFVVVEEPLSSLRRLYAVGDILADPNVPGRAFQVRRIAAQSIQLAGVPGGAVIRVAKGGVIPGQQWRVVATPVLRSIEYRYVPTGGPLDVKPRVVELREDYAALEVDTPSSVSAPPRVGMAGPAPSAPVAAPPEKTREFANTLLGRVRVRPTVEDNYEIDAGDLDAALERRAQLLAETWPKVWPTGSPQSGIGLQIQSPIADGTLGPQGFRVTSPNLAERGGIEVGDVIVGVNGQPVNGFADVYRVYRQLQRDATLSVIQLDLERQGRHLTKTYRIR